MSRIQLTDGTGRWFNNEAAEAFKEETRFDGNNWISLATGSQFHHEMLYRTKGGRWILNRWSQYQGGRETYTEIEDYEAAVWLSINKHEPHEACKEEFAALEIE